MEINSSESLISLYTAAETRSVLPASGNSSSSSTSVPDITLVAMFLLVSVVVSSFVAPAFVASLPRQYASNSGIALSAGNSLVPFVKDPKTGIWSLEFEIPEDSERIVIYGSSNGRNYSGLWSYELE